jgi:GNAT superfamily N-acetyltransferase
VDKCSDRGPEDASDTQDIAVTISIRLATTADASAISALIDASVRRLSEGYYSAEEIERALVRVFGVDSQLIADGTYYVAEENGEIVGCGGWGRRATLYGGDQAERNDAELDPATDAAKIRAFYVAPTHARRGIARQLLDVCESAARAHGFRRAELAATLPGVPLYAAMGYAGDEEVASDLGEGYELKCVRMEKVLV